MASVEHYLHCIHSLKNPSNSLDFSNLEKIIYLLTYRVAAPSFFCLWNTPGWVLLCAVYWISLPNDCQLRKLNKHNFVLLNDTPFGKKIGQLWSCISNHVRRINMFLSIWSAIFWYLYSSIKLLEYNDLYPAWEDIFEQLKAWGGDACYLPPLQVLHRPQKHISCLFSLHLWMGNITTAQLVLSFTLVNFEPSWTCLGLVLLQERKRSTLNCFPPTVSFSYQ